MPVIRHPLAQLVNPLARQLGRPWLFIALLTLGLQACAISDPGSTPGVSDASRAAAPTLLLLGEVHDNPAGHRQRLRLLEQHLAAGWRPALVMEQFDRGQQARLDVAMATCDDADCVISKAGGERWEWSFYRPLIALALRHDLPVVAANVSRAEAWGIVQKGFASALDDATRQRYRLDAPLPADLLAGQRQAIDIGHCGKLPAAMAPGMIKAQVARDLWMANMLEEHAARGAVLIAGNGHVRRDIGVVRWLPPALAAVTEIHGFVEAGQETPAELAPQFDQIHFIPAHPRPDPCAGLTLPAAGKPPPAQP